MSQQSIQMTQFQVEKLQCIGGEGRAAPYRVTTYQGQDLGFEGKVMDAHLEAANGARFQRKPFDFLARMLHTFNSRKDA